MIAVAARSGQLFNASSVANDIDVDYKTVQAWTSILQASGIIRVIHPFWPNTGKRLTKTPKVYFMDTGLVCHLTRWNTPDQLRNGTVAGHVFEAFVVSEVLKSYMNAGANLRDVWFYRDSKKREIDLVIQDGHTLHPVEIKTNALVRKDAVKNFGCLEGMAGYEVGFGHVVCQTREPYLLTFMRMADAKVALPVNVSEPRCSLELPTESRKVKFFLGDVGMLTYKCGMDVVRDLALSRRGDVVL